jgi:hypothetical protein
MSTPAGAPAISSLGDIASSRQFAEIDQLPETLRHLLGPSLRDLPGGEHGPAVQKRRRKIRSMPTGTLRVSVRQTLQLLNRHPLVDLQAWAASQRRLGTLMSQRAVEDDWTAQLEARRRRLDKLADIQAHKRQHRRLIDRERHAEQIPEEHARRYQALCDWQFDRIQQLLQSQWHAQELLDLQEGALDELITALPPHLLVELGSQPRQRETHEVWRQGTLAILRFRKEHHIEDPDRALGDPSVGASRQLRRRQVEIVIDQAHQHGERLSSGEPVNTPDVGLP